MKPLRVKTIIWSKVLWAMGVAFFLFWALVIWNVGFTAFALLSLVIANLFALPFLLFGPIEMDDETIRVTLPTGRFEIAWDEVQSIEWWSYDSGFIVFHGENKKLVMQSIGGCVGADKEQMVALFNHQIETRGIPLKNTIWADWQLSKGTRAQEFL